MDEPAEPRPRGYGARAITEIEIYAVSSIIVLYILACGWTLVSASQGTLSDTWAVAAVISLGLIAPVCTWALRTAVALQGKQVTRPAERGALSSVPGLLLGALQRITERFAGPASRLRPVSMETARVADIGLAVLSVSLFWAFYTGSLLAAVIVPVVVHWVRLSRRRPRGPIQR
ncbi:MAG: hypothetical protein WA903_03690 [Ornithinimicrobium sp.]